MPLRRNARAVAAQAVVVLGAFASTGCFSSTDTDMPLDRLYFPVGAVVSPGGTRLYVASSNFDLQYTNGSVLALDLEAVRARVPLSCSSDADCGAGTSCDLVPSTLNRGEPSSLCLAPGATPCGALRDQGTAAAVLAPGRCGAVDLAKPQDGGPRLILDAVRTGAFATDLVYATRPADDASPGGRLLLPVRGDATLTWIDADDDSRPAHLARELECGQDSKSECDDDHRRGDDPEAENTRDLRLSPEPFGIAWSPDSDAVVLTHQTRGQASLLVNRWGGPSGDGPSLQFILGDLPTRPMGVVALPRPAVTRLPGSDPYQTRFLLTFRDSSEVRLLRYFDDAAAAPARPFLSSDGAAPITANSLGYDSRGIAIDAGERQRREVACAGDADCLAAAADVPFEVYLANRTPASLLVGHSATSPDDRSVLEDLPGKLDALPLSFGPSRVVVANIIGPSGDLEPRVFVLCFDARALYVYDPAAHAIEAVIETGRGPHALAVDVRDGRALGYLVHFTDSYIGVIDLDRRHSATFGRTLLKLGRPTPPRASK